MEARYRRWVRLFPAWWRRAYEEEMISTLLEAADPRQDRVTFGEATDLVRAAITVRVRGLTRTPARLIGTSTVVVLAAAALVSLAVEVPVEFLATSLVVVAIPGTGVIYTVSSSVIGGGLRGLLAAVGCTLGVVPHLLAAMLGLSGLMQTGAAVFETVRWAGVGYLVFMGVSMIRNQHNLGGKSSEPEPLAGHLVVRRAVLLNLLNPKLTLFFFAFLPQFLDAPPSFLDGRLMALAAIFMALTFVVFVVYAGTAAAARDRISEAPVMQRWIHRSLGAVLIGFAARLAVTER